MKILASKELPSTKDLADILQKEFSNRYSCKLFGLGKDKTILVKQSAFVSTQITIRGNEITVQGMPSQFLAVIGMTEGAVLMILFLGWVLRAPWKKLEKEVAVFLHERYH
ncbi:MAG TPA: hypothetical protein PLJ60_11175 [Chryseolinea sp.]|nr:hypothetical protein [Chryseolinea sp.]